MGSERVTTQTPLPPVVETFVAELIAAAAANHADGETGCTARRLVGPLVDLRKEIQCCCRRHGVGFGLPAPNLGNYSLGINNDRRAAAANARLQEHRLQDHRLQTGATGAQDHRLKTGATGTAADHRLKTGATGQAGATGQEGRA